MIRARHTWFHTRFFKWYTRIRLRSNFSGITVHGEVPASGSSILVVSNHFSWWDGFFILWLNDKHLKRKFHVMMLEEQLRNNMILNKTGAFSIRKGSRDLVESLTYAGRILKDSDNLLLMYPQGEIQSMHTPYLHFEPGIERIVRGSEGQVTLLMVCVLTDYFSNAKPELNLFLEEYPLKGPLNLGDLELRFNQLLKGSKQTCNLQPATSNQ